MLDRLYQQAKQKLASLDVRLLMSHALNLSPEEFLLQKDRILTDVEKEKIHGLLAQREAGKPVAKIIGKKYFYDLEFITTIDTLDPRPDSETLIDAVLEKIKSSVIPAKAGIQSNNNLDSRLRGNDDLRILDLGTGTGCLILTLLHHLPLSKGIAVDRSEAALNIAKQNAQNLNLASRIDFIQSDWFEKVAGLFDLIISNPPYIPSRDIETLSIDVKKYDPLGALDGGLDGLDPYRVILSKASAFLQPGGLIAFEVGMGQAADVAQMLKDKGFQRVETHKDLGGIERVVTGYRL